MIPDKAVEAAAAAVKALPGGADSQWAAEVALKTAARFIAAQALRDAADSYRAEWWGSEESVAIKSVRLGFSVTLKTRADELDPS